MPRFYFDVRRDGAPIRTRKMIARAEAAALLSTWCGPRDAPELAIAVRDEEGEPLFEVHALCRCGSPQD